MIPSIPKRERERGEKEKKEGYMLARSTYMPSPNPSDPIPSHPYLCNQNETNQPAISKEIAKIPTK
jgi:hypothetical protein